MSNWMIIALVVLAVVGILLLLNRNRTANTRRIDVERQARVPLGPDYANDREDSRLANMSVDDRDWETASLQRNQANQERLARPVE
jgi:hypothetical protein